MNPDTMKQAWKLCQSRSKESRVLLKSLAGQLRSTGLDATLEYLKNKPGGAPLEQALRQVAFGSPSHGRSAELNQLPNIERFAAMQRAMDYIEALHIAARAQEKMGGAS